jgi:transposase
MAGRGDLTDPAWRRIAGRLPKKGGRGGQWRDHRTVINGLLWKLRPGAPWRDRPERYGAWQTWADRLSRWRRAGTWDRLLAQAQSTTDAGGALDGAGGVDATLVRAHQPARGARHRSRLADRKRGCSTRRTRRSDAAAGA